MVPSNVRTSKNDNNAEIFVNLHSLFENFFVNFTVMCENQVFWVTWVTLGQEKRFQ